MPSSDTNNLLTSIPYAAFGDLVEFDFTYPDALTATQAFSVFSMDNSIYTNMLPSGQSFSMQNATNFITAYPPPPPHGTPIPWLINYGFTTNFAAAELIATNGMPVWQDYLAGLNPRTRPHGLRFGHSLRAGPNAADHLQHGGGPHLSRGNGDQPGRLVGTARQHPRHRRQHPLYRQPNPQRSRLGVLPRVGLLMGGPGANRVRLKWVLSA